MTPTAEAPGPPPDCPLCPRLCAFRAANRAQAPDWHNAPVPSFGSARAALLVVGLAPGLRGANRTGRPFTGDYAGEVLYPALVRHGLARGAFAARVDDGLELVDCRIANAVRCVPPQNRPLPAEIATCRRFLVAELAAVRPAVLLVLGRIAHETTLRALGHRAAAWPFAHGALHRLPGGPSLVVSFHCSRYNINTGRLTAAMLDAAVALAAAEVARAAASAGQLSA